MGNDALIGEALPDVLIDATGWDLLRGNGVSDSLLTGGLRSVDTVGDTAQDGAPPIGVPVEESENDRVRPSNEIVQANQRHDVPTGIDHRLIPFRAARPTSC